MGIMRFMGRASSWLLAFDLIWIIMRMDWIVWSKVLCMFLLFLSFFRARVKSVKPVNQ